VVGTGVGGNAVGGRVGTAEGWVGIGLGANDGFVGIGVGMKVGLAVGLNVCWLILRWQAESL